MLFRSWVKAMPRLGSFPREVKLSEMPTDLATKMRAKVNAIELFIACANLAQGLLVYLSIYHADTVAKQARFWLRTKRGGVAGERIAAAYVKLSLRNLGKAMTGANPLEKFISEKQGWKASPEDLTKDTAA